MHVARSHQPRSCCQAACIPISPVAHAQPSCLPPTPQGLAREVVNRVQRLRKKAGLQATDAGAL